jgi:hypothetical protein
MTPEAARKISTSPAFVKKHREWIQRPETQDILNVIRTLVCRPVMLPIEKVTAERSIFANAFSAGAVGFADVMEDISTLRVIETQLDEKFESVEKETES